jgi:hypothetical protein
MRETLIEVFHDRAGIVENQFPVHQCRQAVVGIQVDQVLGLVIAVDIHHFHRDAFFREHQPYPMALRVGCRREQGHDRTSIGNQRHAALLPMENLINPRCVRPRPRQVTGDRHPYPARVPSQAGRAGHGGINQILPM